MITLVKRPHADADTATSYGRGDLARPIASQTRYGRVLERRIPAPPLLSWRHPGKSSAPTGSLQWAFRRQHENTRAGSQIKNHVNLDQMANYNAKSPGRRTT